MYSKWECVCVDVCTWLDLIKTSHCPLTVISVLPSPQTHEFLCIQSEPDLCDPGPVGGTAFPQRQHQPAGHGHGRHRQTGSHDIPGLWWRVLTQKTGERLVQRKSTEQNNNNTHIKKTITGAGIEEQSCPQCPSSSLQKIVNGLCFPSNRVKIRPNEGKRKCVGKCVHELSKEKYPLFSFKDWS